MDTIETISDVAGPSAVTSVPLAPSRNGRVSGKPWKEQKTASKFVSISGTISTAIDRRIKSARRSHLSAGLRTKSWDERMRKATEAAATKKLELELRQEKQDEIKA